MRKLLAGFTQLNWTKQPAKRRPAVAPVAIERLELKQLLSATTTADVAAEVGDAEAGSRAVTRINVSGEYDLYGGGTMVITQEGLTISATISRPDNMDPNGTFTASFKKDKSKVAKGTGVFILDGEESNVKVKIKFKPYGDSYEFNYSWKRIKDRS